MKVINTPRKSNSLRAQGELLNLLSPSLPQRRRRDQLLVCLPLKKSLHIYPTMSCVTFKIRWEKDLLSRVFCCSLFPTTRRNSEPALYSQTETVLNRFKRCGNVTAGSLPTGILSRLSRRSLFFRCDLLLGRTAQCQLRAAGWLGHRSCTCKRW